MPPDHQSANRPGKGERILLVDDDKSILKVSQQMLTRLGYQVVSRTSGRAALTLFQANPDHFDLIITDEAVPELRGIDLAREMIQIRPEIPIILYSGCEEIFSPEMTSWPWFRARIQKPVRFSVLAETVRQVLEQS